MLQFLILFPLFLLGKSYIILTYHYPPLVYCDLGSKDISKMKGTSIELISQIVTALDWQDWEIECTTQDDMIRRIKSGQADMAEAGIHISAEGLSDFKYSTPTLDSGLVILVKNFTEEFFWLFLEPFNWNLWILIIAGILFMAHILWVLERSKVGDLALSYRTGIIEAIYFSFMSLVFMGKLRIRTIPARILLVAYWTVNFTLFGAYVAVLSSRISVPMKTSIIESYKDLEGMKVGTYQEFKSIMEDYGAIVQIYERTQEGNDQLTQDILNEKIDAGVLEVPVAYMYNSDDCDFKIAGDIFYSINYAFIFPYNADPSLIQDVSIANSLLYKYNFQRNSKNMYMLVTTEESCSYQIETPVMPDQVIGIWAMLAIGAAIGIPLYFIYRRYFIKYEDDLAGIRAMRKKLDSTFTQNAELISKFESILLVTQDKIADQVKELENILNQYTESALTFEESIRLLSQKLDYLNGS